MNGPFWHYTFYVKEAVQDKQLLRELEHTVQGNMERTDVLVLDVVNVNRASDSRFSTQERACYFDNLPQRYPPCLR